jgi:hypothetical protein
MADTNGEIQRHRTAAQREVDELTNRKNAITGHLDQLRRVLGVPPPPAGPPSSAPEADRFPVAGRHRSPPAAPARPGSGDDTTRAGAGAGAAGAGTPAAGQDDRWPPGNERETVPR